MFIFKDGCFILYIEKGVVFVGTMLSPISIYVVKSNFIQPLGNQQGTIQ